MRRLLPILQHKLSILPVVSIVLPFRILVRYLGKPKQETAMETIGKLREAGPCVKV